MGGQEAGIVVDGDIAIAIRRSARARRMTLRVARAGGGVVLTLPLRASLKEAQAFAQSRAQWLRQARLGMAELRRVDHGTLLPVGGRKIEVTPYGGRLVRQQGDCLFIPESRPAGVVVAAWLKQVARSQLAAACDRHAARLGLGYAALSLRDTRSRWGSCTHDRRLMFSWRLAMAPFEVLDYVAAHEVAHLRHMDHSQAFWDCCAALMPEHAAHRRWLKDHGHELIAWDFGAA